MARPSHAAPGPIVSVVIPCRNAAAWIEQTVASVIDQRVPEIEILLVDDGSDDESITIAQRVAGSALRVLRQSKLGVSQARNAGTAAARGAYLQYLDADDMLEAGTIGRRLHALERTGADIAYCHWVRWAQQADGSFASVETVRRTLGDRPDVDLLTDAWWPPGALLYRRTIVDRVGAWREDLPVIQDARFLLDAALHGATFACVDEVGLRYRVHGADSVSRRDPRAFADDVYRSVSDLQAAWEQDGGLDAPRRRGLVRVYAYLARAYFPCDRARFQEIVGRLRRLDPTFLPERPRSLRTLSRVVGYPAAEHVAMSWRKLKAWVSPA